MLHTCMMLSRLINQKWDENVANEIFMHDGAGGEIWVFFSKLRLGIISQKKEVVCMIMTDVWG